jgi:hypothetical protein
LAAVISNNPGVKPKVFNIRAGFYEKIEQNYFCTGIGHNKAKNVLGAIYEYNGRTREKGYLF